MTIIRDAKIYNVFNWRNAGFVSVFQLLIDENPKFVYEKKQIGDKIVYFSEIDGFMDCFIHINADYDENRISTRNLIVLMKDGTSEHVKRVQSSCFAIINPFFPNCFEVQMTSKANTFAFQYRFDSCFVTFEKAKEILTNFEIDYEITEHVENSRICYHFKEKITKKALEPQKNLISFIDTEDGEKNP